MLLAQCLFQHVRASTISDSVVCVNQASTYHAANEGMSSLSAADCCCSGNIRTIMITGDYHHTAISVARNVGMLDKADPIVVIDVPQTLTPAQEAGQNNNPLTPSGDTLCFYHISSFACSAAVLLHIIYSHGPVAQSCTEGRLCAVSNVSLSRH